MLFFLLLSSRDRERARQRETEREEKIWYCCRTLFSAERSRFILLSGIGGSVRHAVHLSIAALPIPIDPDGPPTAGGSVPADFSL